MFRFLGFSWKDSPKGEKDEKILSKISAVEENHTVLEKMKRMFSVDEYGNLSQEMNSITQAGFLGLFVGALYGGVTHSRTSFTNFMHHNQATAFENHFEAKKKLQESMTLGFAKGAFKWGWRLGLFTTSYTAIITTISSYRGKSSIIEYLAAGGITGAIYKFNMGLKGMAAGGVFGTLLGGVAGALSLLILKFSGTTMEDIRYWQYKFHHSRRKLEKELYVSDEGRDKPPIMMDHESRVGTQKLTLDNLNIELKRLETNANKKI